MPLTVFDLWSNGFGINAEAAGWIALAAVATWLVAFNAYYYALRGERVAVVAPISQHRPGLDRPLRLADRRAPRSAARRWPAWPSRWPASC